MTRRVAAGTKIARQVMARNSRIDKGPGLTLEQQMWNARVDIEKQAKKKFKMFPPKFKLK